MRKTFFAEMFGLPNEKLNLISCRCAREEIKISTYVAVNTAFAQQHSPVFAVLPNVAECGGIQRLSGAGILDHLNTNHQSLKLRLIYSSNSHT